MLDFEFPYLRRAGSTSVAAQWVKTCGDNLDHFCRAVDQRDIDMFKVLDRRVVDDSDESQAQCSEHEGNGNGEANVSQVAQS